MNIKNIVFVTLAAYIVCIGLSCEDDDQATICDRQDSYLYPACPDYDPCATVDPAISDFSMGLKVDNLSFYDTVFNINIDDGDTLTSTSITFEALTNADEYVWSLSGTNQVWNGKTETIAFTSDIQGVSVTITLTTYKNDSLGCLSEAERSSSSAKTIHFPIYNTYEEIQKIRGSFVGNICDAPEIFDTIHIVEGSLLVDSYIEDFPDDCIRLSDSPNAVRIAPNYRKFILYATFINDEQCGIPIGQGVYADDLGSIEFNYTHTNPDGSKESRCWRGERID